MMMKRFILLMCMMVAMMATATAQNKIDRLVEQYSATGRSSFTSAVERDSETGNVRKVVKRLRLKGEIYKQFLNVFEEESSKGKFSSKRENGETTMILTTSDSKANSVYMLRITGDPPYPESEITIVRTMKKARARR